MPKSLFDQMFYGLRAQFATWVYELFQLMVLSMHTLKDAQEHPISEIGVVDKEDTYFIVLSCFEILFWRHRVFEIVFQGFALHQRQILICEIQYSIYNFAEVGVHGAGCSLANVNKIGNPVLSSRSRLF